MNPSSPSNVDHPVGPTFKVTSRALSADLSTARSDESVRELGTPDGAGLVALMEKLAVLDASEVAEADPQLVVTGRRGRFTVRPGRGLFLLRSATDGTQNYLELPAAEIPAFLDGKEMPSAAPVDSVDPLVVSRPTKTRLTLALTLFALAVLIVAASGWFTFRPAELDPASDYVTISASADAATLRQQAIGTYVSGSGDDERILEVTANGTARYREYGTGHELVAEREGSCTVARRRKDQTVVLRVSSLGTIELTKRDTLTFAGDAYQRRPTPGSANP
jgi:hypothetical protein